MWKRREREPSTGADGEDRMMGADVGVAVATVIGCVCSCACSA